MRRLLPIALAALPVLGCQWSVQRVGARQPIGSFEDPWTEDRPWAEDRLEPSLLIDMRPLAEGREPNVPLLPIHLEVDWELLAEFEGRRRTAAYVPSDPETGGVLGRSGVTIGTGFDLGQHDVAELRAMGVDGDVVATLEPYLRLRGDRARAFLDQHPLTLDAPTVAELDRAKLRDTVLKVGRAFDRDRSPGVPSFGLLTRSQRTAIASLALQYGPGLDRRTPIFWRAVVEGRFGPAAAELRDFGDRYPTRRAREAELLVATENAVRGPGARFSGFHRH